MIKIFIKPINELIIVNEEITNMCFVDKTNYRDFVINLYDNIILSIDDTPVSIDSKALIIFDPLNIEINDKKTLTLLYKKLSHRVSEKVQEKIRKIEQDILELLEIVSVESMFPIEYEDSFELIKIFQMYQISIQELKKENYLEFIVTYIKTNLELNNYNIVVSFGLTRLLTADEINKLTKELAINQISIVDFYYDDSKPKDNYLVIDSDWSKI